MSKYGFGNWFTENAINPGHINNLERPFSEEELVAALRGLSSDLTNLPTELTRHDGQFSTRINKYMDKTSVDALKIFEAILFSDKRVDPEIKRKFFQIKKYLVKAVEYFSGLSKDDTVSRITAEARKRPELSFMLTAFAIFRYQYAQSVAILLGSVKLDVAKLVVDISVADLDFIIYRWEQICSCFCKDSSQLSLDYFQSIVKSVKSQQSGGKSFNDSIGIGRNLESVRITPELRSDPEFLFETFHDSALGLIFGLAGLGAGLIAGMFGIVFGIRFLLRAYYFSKKKLLEYFEETEAFLEADAMLHSDTLTETQKLKIEKILGILRGTRELLTKNSEKVLTTAEKDLEESVTSSRYKSPSENMVI